MFKTICIHGRLPALGRAELESLYGAEALTPIGDTASGLTLAPAQIDFNRLGGTVKFCKLLTVLETTNWPKIQDFLESAVPQHVVNLPEGKMKLGLSVYGLDVSPKTINATGLQLKKIIKSTGRSVRVVPNVEKALNSAKVLHNQLTSALGWELVFIRDGTKTVLAQNIAEQDITAYANRDQARPKRDARIGMLPPKLAQIIVNLAVGQDNISELSESFDSSGIDLRSKISVLDPFCGTGVVLQESLLMGYDAYGTDIQERMVDYSKANLDWLADRYKLENQSYLLETGDATNFQWQSFDVVACETYLGRPFSAQPKPELLREVMQDVDTIHRKFLKNLARQTKPGFRLCLAVPAWASKSLELRSQSLDNNSEIQDLSSKLSFKHLPVLDSLPELGYTRLSFVHVSKDKLIYHREGQIVARELVVLVRK